MTDFLTLQTPQSLLEADYGRVVKRLLSERRSEQTVEVAASAIPQEPESPGVTIEVSVAESPKETQQKPAAQKVQKIVNYKSMTVKKLKTLLKKRDLSLVGRKADLIARLEEDDAA